MSILMCRPDHFGVEYEINPWMHVENDVDRALAVEQWERLHRTYLEMGQQVELVEPVRGLPDMVFTANAGVLWKRRVVVSRFHHPERQGEESHFARFFEEHGFEVHMLDRGVSMEGAGDFLFVGETLFCGTGFRTDRTSHAEVGRILGVETVSVELTDPRFYHLDTCFCPLDDETVLLNPRAFTAASLDAIRSRVPRIVEAPESVAAGFACNALPVGRTVVASSAIDGVEKQLAEIGFGVRGLPMTEFMKSGGGVRCLTLPLDLGLVAARR